MHQFNLKPKRKSHLFFAAIGLMIIIGVIVHVVAAVSISKGEFSLNNPVTYLVIGLMLVLVIFKLKIWKRKL